MPRHKRCPECDSLVGDDGQAIEKGRVYRETEFRVIAPHGGGPSERAVTITFQINPKYKRVMELLFSDSRTPWRTESDVARAFMDYGAHFFGAAIGGKIITGVLHQLDMMNRLVDQAREGNDFAESIDQLGVQIERYESGGMRESAVGLVYHYRELAKTMPDKILRRKLVADINQRWGYLLKGNQGRKEHERPGARIEADDHDDHESRDEDEQER
jgi:hypothetical protein